MSAKTEEERERQNALDQLTDEERAAISEELDENERAALEELAGDADDEDADDDTGSDDDNGGDDDADEGDGGEGEEANPAKEADKAAPAAPEKPPVEAAVDAPPPVEAADDDDAPQGIAYESELPADFNDRVKAIEDAEADLAQKFEDGEIDAQAYIRETRKISNERGELDRIRVKAEVSAEMMEQNALNNWNRQVDKFMRDAKAKEGIDYRGNDALSGDLDTLVKAIASKPENAGKSGEWILDQSHKAVKAMHGIADKKPAPPDVKDTKPASRKPPIDKAPKTLAHVPGASGPGDMGDEFANLDDLEGDAYENALAKLTPAQRDRYLAAA